MKTIHSEGFPFGTQVWVQTRELNGPNGPQRAQRGWMMPNMVNIAMPNMAKKELNHLSRVT